MSLLLSDGIGALAGVMIAVPPLRDQYARAVERRHRNAPNLPKLRGLLRASLKEKRDSFNGYDTLFLAIGSLGLVASFLLKGWDL
jgi:hypothetical protein